MFGEHVSFVARLRRVHVEIFAVADDADFAVKFRAITSIQNHDSIAHVANFFGEPLSRGSFARAADRDVSETYHEAIQSFLARKAEFITEQAQIDETFVNQRENKQHENNQPTGKPVDVLVVHELENVSLHVLDFFRRAQVTSIFTRLVFGQHFAEEDGGFS